MCNREILVQHRRFAPHAVRSSHPRLPDNLDLAGASRNRTAVIGRDQVVGVDYVLEGGHLLDPRHKRLDAGLVAKNGRDLALRRESDSDERLVGLYMYESSGEERRCPLNMPSQLLASRLARSHLLDCVNDGVHAEGGVDGGHDDGLGEGALSGNLPLRAGVLEDGDGAGGLKLVERSGGGSGNEAGAPEGSTELVGLLSNLSIRPPLSLAKVLSA